MWRLFKSWIDRVLADTTVSTFAERSQARFFVGLLLASVTTLLMLLGAQVFSYRAPQFLILVGLLALVVVALDLVRRNRLPSALRLYAWALPFLFSLRYFVTALEPGTVPEPTYSDYFLAYSLLNLVLQTLVTSSTRPLFLALGISIPAELVNVVGVLLPANAVSRGPEIWSGLLRFIVIMSLLTALLVRLQKTYLVAARQYDKTQHQLEALVEKRTQALMETQQRLERAGSSLAEGEKLASLGRIVAGIAHEMNTPLAAIQASAEHLGSKTMDILQRWTSMVPHLGDREVARLLELLREVEFDVTKLDSRRTREHQKAFAAELEAKGILDSKNRARILAEFGLKHLSKRWMDLVRGPQADLALERMAEVVEWMRSASIVSSASARVADQVTGLRRYSVNPKPGSVLGPVDLGQTIETVLLVYRSQFPKGIKIVCQIPKKGPWVLGNADRLMQVWSNLIMNAVQALGTDGKIVVSVRTDKGQVTSVVSDNGPGIPYDIQERVLEPFFSTKPNGQGMGLGLKIVQTIVSEHSGELTFESKPGQTAFTVRFPALKDSGE